MNADGYANSRYTIAVAALSKKNDGELLRYLTAQPPCSSDGMHGVLMAIVDGLNPARGGQSYLSGSLAIQPLACTGGEQLAGLAASLRKDLSTELSRSGLTVTFAEDDPSSRPTSTTATRSPGTRRRASASIAAFWRCSPSVGLC